MGKKILSFFICAGLTLSFLPFVNNSKAAGSDIVPSDYSDTGYHDYSREKTVIDMTGRGVYANDESDDTAAIQSVIDSLNGVASAQHHYILQFPSGEINISDEIHIDVSGITVKGTGRDPDTGTSFVFKPAGSVVYPSNYWGEGEAEPDIDGKMWPGYAAFRVETRIKDPRETAYEGSVNFHWRTGAELDESGAKKGDTTIKLDKNGAASFTVGGRILIRAANTLEFYEETAMRDINRDDGAHIRTQTFTVTAVDIMKNTITIDRPLEFDLVYASPNGYNSKVMPITSITDIGFEDFYFTQSLEHTKYSEFNPQVYDAVTNPYGVGLRYENVAYEYAIHGILFKFAGNSYVNNVKLEMTGSHPIVTEFAYNLTVSNNEIDGSWNKGKGGHGYLRFSKIDNSLLYNNKVRNVRHLAIQWSSSANIIKNNDLDCDINLHGGWERNNWIIGNISHIPYEHRSWANGKPESGTWYPVFWSPGYHASNWASSSGYNNILFANEFFKQESEGAQKTFWSRYCDPSTIYHFGWNGTSWQHLLDSKGQKIQYWGGRENDDFTNKGIYNEGIPDLKSGKLTKTSVSVKEGKAETIKLASSEMTVYEPLVEWESSNESIATVTFGKIIGISQGNTTVTAKYPTGETFTCEVTVLEGDPVTDPVFTISKTSLNMYYKQQYALSVLKDGVPVPATSVTWKSGISYIAVNQYGIITANNKSGGGTVTASYNGMTFTCDIKLYPSEEDLPDEPIDPPNPDPLTIEEIIISPDVITCETEGGTGTVYYWFYILKDGNVLGKRAFIRENTIEFSVPDGAMVRVYCTDSTGVRLGSYTVK